VSQSVRAACAGGVWRSSILTRPCRCKARPAVAKAPRWIKHDRGQSEPPQRRTRTAPAHTAAAQFDDRAPPSGGPVCPHTPQPEPPGRQDKCSPTTTDWLFAVMHSFGKPVERDLIAPAAGTSCNLRGRKRETLRLSGPSEHRAQVTNDLKPPVRVVLGSVELLSVDIRWVGEGAVSRQQWLAPALDLDRMWRPTVGRRAEQITASLMLGSLSEQWPRLPPTRQLAGAHDLDCRVLGVRILASRQ
jgi:hypothetical protein